MNENIPKILIPKDPELFQKVFERVMSGEVGKAMADQIMTAEGKFILKEDIEEAKYRIGVCYETIIEQMKEYLDLPEDYYKFIALWTIGTYFHEEFNTYPFLFFNAMRGSGKTRLLKFISSLANKGDGTVINSITDAVFFRHERGKVLCIDEIEGIAGKEKTTLRELLNSAYKKGMKVSRMQKVKTKDGEEQQTKSFEPYFPIALANIFGIEEVLGDRSITFILEKSNDPYFTKRIEDFDTNETILSIKQTLNRISVVCVMSLHKKNYILEWNKYIKSKYNRHNNTNDITTYNDTNGITSLNEVIEREEFFNKIDNTGINGRNFELLFPLLILAKMINDETFLDILEIGKRIMDNKQEEEFAESRDVSLFEFVANNGTNDFVSLKDLVGHFKLFVGDTKDDESWVNERWMGRALKRLKLIKSKRREASGRFVIVDIEKAKEKLKIFK